MKNLFICLFIMTFVQSANAHPSQALTNYSDLLNAVTQGDSVRVISPRKNGHLTKRPFVLQNTPGLNNQV
jgi:hypothetical protein